MEDLENGTLFYHKWGKKIENEFYSAIQNEFEIKKLNKNFYQALREFSQIISKPSYLNQQTTNDPILEEYNLILPAINFFSQKKGGLEEISTQIEKSFQKIRDEINSKPYLDNKIL